MEHEGALQPGAPRTLVHTAGGQERMARGGGKGSAGQDVGHTELTGSRKGHLGCAAVVIVTRALRPQGDAAGPAPILPTLCGPPLEELQCGGWRREVRPLSSEAVLLGRWRECSGGHEMPPSGRRCHPRRSS